MENLSNEARYHLMSGSPVVAPVAAAPGYRGWVAVYNLEPQPDRGMNVLLEAELGRVRFYRFEISQECLDNGWDPAGEERNVHESIVAGFDALAEELARFNARAADLVPAFKDKDFPF